ncbi:MAG: efflux transporter periplasmic adaptor subunit [Flavobacteriales bacterium MED-G15]|nr:MAG: efflux transporter periplasmic adaptor subunit [Flavobacteriales bacterium MED-G15]|tara:strand:- start:886 stop:2052 length:1167 start_codon:yes stop_codon:yes gene_type:complete
MKKLISLLITSIIIAACSGEKQSSTSALLQAEDLDGLKVQKDEKIQQMNALKKELNQINQAILTLDPDEKLPLITTIKLAPENFNHHIEVQGNIQTRQNVLLYPEFNGSLKQVFVQEGQKVKKGALLAQIDDAGLKNQLEQLEIQSNLSKTIYERYQRLWDKNIGSEMELLKAKTTYEAQLKSIAQLKKQLLRTQIRAPFSGTIDEIIANTGANLMPGQTPVLRVVNLDEMYIEANIPERYVSDIKLGTDALVEIPMLGKTYATQIRQTGSFINPNNRSFRVEAPLANTDGDIKPNLSCKLKIKDYNNSSAIMIPLSIIKENAKGDKYIFKLKPGNKQDVYTTEKVFIELGKKSMEKVEVTGGIAPGTLIVNEGAAIVEDNQRVRNIQ